MNNKKSVSDLIMLIGHHLIGAIVILILLAFFIPIIFPQDYNEEIRDSHINSIKNFIEYGNTRNEETDCYYLFNLNTLSSLQNPQAKETFGFEINTKGIKRTIHKSSNGGKFQDEKNEYAHEFSKKINLKEDETTDDFGVTSSNLVLKNIKYLNFKIEGTNYDFSYEGNVWHSLKKQKQTISYSEPFLVYQPKTNNLFITEKDFSNHIVSQNLCKRKNIELELLKEIAGTENEEEK